MINIFNFNKIYGSLDRDPTARLTEADAVKFIDAGIEARRRFKETLKMNLTQMPFTEYLSKMIEYLKDNHPLACDLRNALVIYHDSITKPSCPDVVRAAQVNLREQVTKVCNLTASEYHCVHAIRDTQYQLTAIMTASVGLSDTDKADLPTGLLAVNGIVNPATFSGGMYHGWSSMATEELVVSKIRKLWADPGQLYDADFRTGLSALLEVA